MCPQAQPEPHLLPVRPSRRERVELEAILQYTKANYKKTDPNFSEFSDNWVGKD